MSAETSIRIIGQVPAKHPTSTSLSSQPSTLPSSSSSSSYTSLAPSTSSSPLSSPLTSLRRGVCVYAFHSVSSSVISIQFSCLTPSELRIIRRVSKLCHFIFYSEPLIRMAFSRALCLTDTPLPTHAEMNERMTLINLEVRGFLISQDVDLPLSNRDPLTEYMRLTEAARQTSLLRHNGSLENESLGWTPRSLFGYLFSLQTGEEEGESERITTAQIKELYERGLDITRDYRDMLHYSFINGTLEEFCHLLTYLVRIKNPQEIRLETSLPAVRTKRTVIAKLEAICKHEPLKASLLQNGLAGLWGTPREIDPNYSMVNSAVQEKLIKMGARVTIEALFQLMNLEEVPRKTLQYFLNAYIEQNGPLTPDFIIAILQSSVETVIDDPIIFLIIDMKCPVNQEVLYAACKSNQPGIRGLIVVLIEMCHLIFDTTCLINCIASRKEISRSWVSLEKLSPPTPSQCNAIFASLSYQISRERGDSDCITTQEIVTWFKPHFTFNSTHLLSLLHFDFIFETPPQSLIKAWITLGLPLNQESSDIIVIAFPGFKGIPDVLPPPRIPRGDDPTYEATMLRYTKYFLDASIHSTTYRSLCSNFTKFLQRCSLRLPQQAIKLLMDKKAVKENEPFMKWLRTHMPTGKFEI